ncbi:MAG: SsrA-binding protein SmpB [Deltaproteobacteria bacterium]|jgi:SsrA-binding protein|nr:SsrA-binding protein SmpB [Deltaproteobacteria bacterium]
MPQKKPASSLAHNKKARHYYELLEFTEAGLMLTGSEVKSIRAGKVSFNDAYVSFRPAGAFLLGLHIAPYANAGYAQHQPERERKLLLHAREIEILSAKVEQKGLALIPVNLHFSGGWIKVELAVGRGKKLHDQRQDLKDAAERRDLERELFRKF